MSGYLSKEEYIAKYYNEPKQELLTDLYYKTRDNILLQQENKQLKEQLENKKDLYEDTISYQLGFDRGKEYMQQRIDKAIEYIKELYDVRFTDKDKRKLLEILGDKE